MKKLLFCIGICATGVSLALDEVTLDVSKPVHKVPSTLFGIFLEDTGMSLDGSLCAEMVRNGSFEPGIGNEKFSATSRGAVVVRKEFADGEKLQFWNSIANAELSASREMPVGGKYNCTSLRVAATEGGQGVANEGYFGMAVRRGESYNLSFKIRGSVKRVQVTIEGWGNAPICERCVVVDGKDAWQDVTFALKALKTDVNARLAFRALDPGEFYLDCVSLMPAKTFKGHGMRQDVAEHFAALRPAFMRFPGGCWVEGVDEQTAYDWKRTLGDRWERPHVYNMWNYWSSNIVGFHEYLQFAEDIGALPLYDAFCGMTCEFRKPQTIVPMEKMDKWVQDALDAIEYANGPVESKWGALRAKAGHPEPFGLKWIEIGNENHGPEYNERFALFYDAIRKTHPEIGIVAGAWNGVPDNRPLDLGDEHYYCPVEKFLQKASQYDNYDRKGYRVFVGEYGCTKAGEAGTLRGAIGEAAFMTGMERNCDIVAMAAYAPILGNVHNQAWNPYLQYCDSARVCGTPSYHVQKLFAENQGEFTAKVSASGTNLFVSAMLDKGAPILKIVNAEPEAREVRLNIPGFGQKDAKLVLLSHENAFAKNTLAEPLNVSAKTSRGVYGEGSVLKLPGNSLAILRW